MQPAFRSTAGFPLHGPDWLQPGPRAMELGVHVGRDGGVRAEDVLGRILHDAGAEAERRAAREPCGLAAVLRRTGGFLELVWPILRRERGASGGRAGVLQESGQGAFCGFFFFWSEEKGAGAGGSRTAQGRRGGPHLVLLDQVLQLERRRVGQEACYRPT